MSGMTKLQSGGNFEHALKNGNLKVHSKSVKRVFTTTNKSNNYSISINAKVALIRTSRNVTMKEM